MKRTLIVLALLAISAVAIAQQEVGPESVENCVYIVEHDKVLCDLVDVTTTTTEATTTTTVDTTTTTEPTTTTTAPPTGLVIPPTQPYGGGPYKDGGGYDIMAINADTGTVWWVAPYWGDNGLPYTDGATWLDGDREGYRCGYGFITDASGWDIHGRFAFVRPPDQAYGKVNDKYMDEAERYLDGTPTTFEGNEIPDEDCTDVLSDIDYEGACRPVDERPRVAFFDGAGKVLDIRDYTNTDANNVNFNLHAFDGQRATVIACEDGQVGMIVYYDAMGSGQIAVDFNG